MTTSFLLRASSVVNAADSANKIAELQDKLTRHGSSSSVGGPAWTDSARKTLKKLKELGGSLPTKGSVSERVFKEYSKIFKSL